MDDSDRAQINEEREREAAALLRKPTLQAIKACWNCGEPLGHGRLFCSIECRDDYQKMQDDKKRNG